jgi:hypothetical protein
MTIEEFETWYNTSPFTTDDEVFNSSFLSHIVLEKIKLIDSMEDRAFLMLKYSNVCK